MQIKNWKTTAFGTLAALGMGLPITGIITSDVILKICQVVAAVGSLGVAVSAKDKDVSGAGASARRIKE